ncbi:hypothetical protein [Synechococcus sp. LA31]|uniref:hypothetical protein n=1 Tax=Synechococcus sp. LA31 TaxID=2741953 RepID=UPI001BDCB27E|nr:hypothetical protein [Synechococcus sp. LA31]QVV67558.1 hypothetical protein KJJ24_14360 [Synechococcus sp. LA31]
MSIGREDGFTIAMAYCRALVPFRSSNSPGELLRPLLEQLGLEVEQPDQRTLMAFERPCAGRRVNDYVRVWADWSDIASTGELWLETLSGECMAHSSTRCASVLDRICSGLNR